jgi:hypothetical protein
MPAKNEQIGFSLPTALKRELQEVATHGGDLRRYAKGELRRLGSMQKRES